MSHYNLIDEKWIPVRMLDGNHQLFGIAETLQRAKEIAAIEDASPLVVASLYRFLLALLYRAMEGPCDIEEAERLFEEGFPQEKINSYLLRWRDRFWLFDEKYPFGQIPSFEPEAWRAWTTLTAEHNADNAKVLFDHVDVSFPGRILEARAICGLLATHTFVLSSGKSELAHTSTAPSATAFMVLPIGRNLEETLVFSLICEGRDIIKEDLPMWEREPESAKDLKSGKKRCIAGIADLYTWRSRSIRLQREANGGVEKVAFASGVAHDNADMRDPMLAYRKDDEKGLLPLQFKEKGLWRDFDSLLPDSSGIAPQVIDHAIYLARFNPERLPRSVMVFGQSNNKAKVEFWRMERFILPLALIGEKSIRAEIRGQLQFAEKVQKILWEACSVFAKCLLTREERPLEKGDVFAFVSQMICIPLYWSEVEAKFHAVLGAYTLDRDPDQIEQDWCLAVIDALKNAWRQHQSSISLSDAWGIRALVKAERFLKGKLIKQFNNNQDFWI